MRLYAIRISNGWVEIRSATRPIKGLKSTITKVLPVQQTKEVREGWRILPGESPWYPDGVPDFTFRTTTVKRKVRLTQTNWTGGKHLGVFEAYTLRGLCKLPPIGMAVSVPKSKASTLIATLRKREHKAAPQGHRTGDAEAFNL